MASVVGGVGGTNTGDMIENLGSLGFDGAWIETEHGPFDYKDLPGPHQGRATCGA